MPDKEFRIWFWVCTAVLALNLAWCSRPVNAEAEPKCLNTEKILDYMTNMTPSRYDREKGESKDERKLRLTPVAKVLSCEARNIREVAFAVTQGWIESKFDSAVMAGQCRKGTCDPDKRTAKPLAKGAWQAQRAPNRWHDLWAIADSDVQASARLQLEMQRAMSCSCNIVHSFAAHGGGGCRETRSAKGRFKVYEKVLAKLSN